MENKEKLKKLAGNIKNAIKVFRIIFLVAMGICFAGAIACVILGATDALTKLYESNVEFFSKVNIDIDSDFDFIKTFMKSNTLGLKDIYEAGELDKLCYFAAYACFIGGVDMLIAFFIAKVFVPVFDKLETSESPFNEEIAKKLKIAFILAFVLVVIKSVVIGLVVGALLGVSYFIYLYGIQLQKNEDETL